MTFVQDYSAKKDRKTHIVNKVNYNFSHKQVTEIHQDINSLRSEDFFFAQIDFAEKIGEKKESECRITIGRLD